MERSLNQRSLNRRQVLRGALVVRVELGGRVKITFGEAQECGAGGCVFADQKSGMADGVPQFPHAGGEGGGVGAEGAILLE